MVLGVIIRVSLKEKPIKNFSCVQAQKNLFNQSASNFIHLEQLQIPQGMHT